MSTMRIFTCLNETVCKITQRGQVVWTRALQGGCWGFGVGAVVGAFAFIDCEVAKKNAYDAEIKNYRGCTVRSGYTPPIINCKDNSMLDAAKQAVGRAGSDAYDDRAKFIASFALPISLAGGMAAGFIIGAIVGACESLPQPVQRAVDGAGEEGTELSISVVDDNKPSKSSGDGGPKYQSLKPSR
jgi:hypothetical protein